MGLINQEGFYKGVIVSGAFGVTKSGLPQSIWMLKASEVYDPEGDEYLPADSEADEITAYLVMFNHDGKENFNNPKIKKVTGWDGGDFNALSEMELAGLELSFKVEYGKGDYFDKLGVNGVDVPGAPPTRTVTKLDKADIDALQAKYAGNLAKTKAPVKATSAKRGRKAPTGDPVSYSPAGAAAPKGRPSAKPPTEAVVGKCSADDAYLECEHLKRDDVTEEALQELWIKEVAKVNVDETKITEEEWFKIKTAILAQISKV